MNKEHKSVLIMGGVVMTAVLVAICILAAGCSSTPPPDPCQVNPTRTNTAGEWVEADGEALDEDPCDSDDLNESGHKKPKKKPVKKPVTRTGGR